MEIRRLGWAGVEIVAQDGTSLVVDYIRDFPLLPAADNEGEYVAPTRKAAAALVTHLHGDHTDVTAIESAVGPRGLVFRPPSSAATGEDAAFTMEAEAALAASALNVETVAEWDRVALAPFIITAVPSVDGLGDPQVNWVVEADGQRVFHGGDTMFHGYWWSIARRVGPIDIAVLPINGPSVDAPHLSPPSLLPAVLTPEQAVQAAVLLRAKALVPMHFGVHQPPIYIEQDSALGQLIGAAEKLELKVISLTPGVSTAVIAAP